LSIGNLKNSRIMVTGAAGFLGSRLIAGLTGRGIWVLGIDRIPEGYNSAATSDKSRQYCYLSAEFNTAADEARGFLSDVSRERRVVFHMAGLADAGDCHDHPDQAFRLNVESTFQVLEMCRQIGGSLLVYPSTGLVYGDTLDYPATEDDPVVPHSVYIATKIAAEALIQSYAAGFEVEAIIARLSNVYGPGVSEKTVIGRIIDQTSRGEPLQVMFNTHIRDFIFSQDVIDALICLSSLKPSKSALIINVSTGEGVSVDTVVSTASHLFAVPVVKPSSKKNMSNKASCLILSNEKIRRLTNWAPRVDITEGLRKSFRRNDISK